MAFGVFLFHPGLPVSTVRAIGTCKHSSGSFSNATRSGECVTFFHSFKALKQLQGGVVIWYQKWKIQRRGTPCRAHGKQRAVVVHFGGLLGKCSDARESPGVFWRRMLPRDAVSVIMIISRDAKGIKRGQLPKKTASIKTKIHSSNVTSHRSKHEEASSIVKF